MIHTDTLPESRAAAQHLAELHLRRARYSGGLRVFARLVEALIGVGYAILALSMEGPAGERAKPLPAGFLERP